MSNVEEKDLLNKGMAEFKQGNLAEAEALFRDFMQRFPRSDLADNAAYNLAKIFMKRNDSVKALEWIEYVLRHYPTSDAAYFAKDEKVELLRELGVRPRETTEDLYFKGKQALTKGDTAGAEKIFGEIIEKDPDGEFTDNAHYNLAEINKARGNLDKARYHVEIIMTRFPDSDAAIYARDLLK